MGRGHTEVFASAIYVRVVTNFVGKATLICSKTNLAPMKDLHIPCVEVMSFVLSMRLLQSAINGLNFDFTNIYCWFYSMVVVRWIGYRKFGSRTLKIFEKDLPEKCTYENLKFD